MKADMAIASIYIGSDHGGFELKQHLIRYLTDMQYDVTDCGPTELDPADDYPPYAFAVGEGVAASAVPTLGILCCRSAAGVTIAANKVLGIRAVAVHDERSAVHAIERDGANVVAFAGDWLSSESAIELLEICLAKKFAQKPRDIRRIAQISDYENKA